MSSKLDIYVAKCFLEKDWGYICDCQEDEDEDEIGIVDYDE